MMLKEFFKTIASEQSVWVMEHKNTIVSLEIPDGTVVPVWSEENMVNSYLMLSNRLDVYKPLQLTLENFLKVWVPVFEENQYILGVNLGVQTGKAEFMSLSDFKEHVASAP